MRVLPMKILWAIMCLAVILSTLPNLSLLELKVAAAKYDETNTQQQPPEAFQIELVLQRIYLDGEMSQETVVETVYSMDDFWAKYDQWQIMDMGKAKFVMRKYEDDISPLLKTNGYFGITNDGTLSIFNGKPQEYNIIQSFFQIDIKKLESNKQTEILQGIPIKTKDKYVEVLETFKVYSTYE